MSVKKLTQTALFLSLGLALHTLVPGTLGNMKPDFLLAMMFVSLMLSDTFSQTLAIGIAFGFASALTTTFPGGEIPNMIDKIVTAVAVFASYKALQHQRSLPAVSLIISLVGTLISGFIFLISAQLISGLPAPFALLFATVVLPATLANTLLVIGVNKIVHGPLATKTPPNQAQ